MVNRKSGNIMLFDQEFFEAILPKNKSTQEPLWEHRFIDGEHCYFVKFNFNEDDPRRIFIRSSIGGNGQSNGAGEDSIRLYVVDKGNHRKVYSGKLSTWVTRRPNWEERLYSQMTILRKIATSNSKKCNCGSYVTFGISKKTGKEWARCFPCEKWY